MLCKRLIKCKKKTKEKTDIFHEYIQGFDDINRYYACYLFSTDNVYHDVIQQSSLFKKNYFNSIQNSLVKKITKLSYSIIYYLFSRVIQNLSRLKEKFDKKDFRAIYKHYTSKIASVFEEI